MVATLHLLSLLPDFVLYPLGALGGLIGYVLDRRHVRIGLKNLELAFARRSKKERRQILRASYVNLGVTPPSTSGWADSFAGGSNAASPMSASSIGRRSARATLAVVSWCCRRISATSSC